ncbi:MAG: FeoB-associated Cys-rich membrane protein [Daejeonella sp.]
MDLQAILVFIVFALAIFAVCRMIYRSINSSKGCASNCGKCAADFSDIKLPESRK